MKEIKDMTAVWIMTNEEFREEMQYLDWKVEKLKEEGWSIDSITNYLVGWVSAETTEKAYTTHQLKQIFALAE